MGRKAKGWLVIAATLVLAGSAIFVGVMIMLKWDFSKLSTVKYETTVHEISKEYQNISVVTDTADIVFLPAENFQSRVVCHEQKNVKHAVAVTDGTLSVCIEDTRKWYEFIGISFGSPKITVYLPQGEYGLLSVEGSTGDVEIPKDYKFESMDIKLSTGNATSNASVTGELKIKTSTGRIQVEGVSAGTIDFSASTGGIMVSDVTCGGDVKTEVSTGKTNLTNIKCKSLISDGDTGDMVLKNVIAEEKFSLERSTGHVKFDGCDAKEFFVKTDTGNVTGSLLSEKVFIVQSDTGRVDVPKTITGGRCEITTDTGDIRITID